MRRQALGKGLKALIPEPEITHAETVGQAIVQLAVDEISPNRYQPRKGFKEESIKELADSIRENGIIQPVVVRRNPAGGYELIAGERRYRAVRSLDLVSIPAIIKDIGDAESLELALIENIQREDLNPIDTARAYQQLIDEFEFTQHDLAKKLGKDRSSIANSLRLLKLPSIIQEDIVLGRLTMGHARALLSLDDEDTQIAYRNAVIQDNLTVREVEDFVRTNSSNIITTSLPGAEGFAAAALVAAGAEGAVKDKKTRPAVRGKKAQQSNRQDVFLSKIEDKIRKRLGAKTHVRGTHDVGRIEIYYHTKDDLERILDFFD